MNFSDEKADDVIRHLMPNYQKLLMINLTNDSYDPIIVADDEWCVIESQPKKISVYWKWFVESDLIHEEDKQKLREFFLSADANKCICYRRKIGSAFKRVVMQICPSVEYTPENKDCVLYVKDIDAIYSLEYESVVDKIGTTDQMTGLFNKLAFQRDIAKYEGKTIGILFGDLNGLKYVNDHEGHSVGDELILKFASLLSMHFKNRYKCYHISGDEFIVVSFGSIRQFLQDSMVFHKSVWSAFEIPIASVGYSVGETDELDQILKDAESSMMDDKLMFYSKYPKLKRV